MKPCEPITPPITWARRPLVSFRKPRAELTHELGAAQARDVDSNGLGQMDVWALRFPCGLELLLLAFHHDATLCEDVTEDEPGWVEIQSNSTEMDHIAAHLPFELADVTPCIPDVCTHPPPQWAVMRQDDNGHVFRAEEHASRCAAEAALGRFEGLSHKQMYWITSLDPCA